MTERTLQSRKALRFAVAGNDGCAGVTTPVTGGRAIVPVWNRPFATALSRYCPVLTGAPGFGVCFNDERRDRALEAAHA